MRVAILTTDNREQAKDYTCPAPYFGTAPAALLQGFSLLPEVEVHVVSCARAPMQSPEKLAPNIWFHSLVVPKIGWMTTGYQGCIRAVRKQLQEIKPDIVHGQGTERECAVSAVFSGFPNVLTIHGHMRRIAELTKAKPFSFGWINARLEAFTLPRSFGVVCITEYTKRSVQQLAKRTWVLPNAVDASFFETARNPEPCPTILVIGTICSYKNQNALIKALDPLREKMNFRVRFFGALSREDYCNEFRELVQARPWCEHLGFINREELKRQLSSAAMLMLPSLEDNCPMVVLEAHAAGVPVVAAHIGGVPDLIRNGINGILCDPRSPESMREAIQRVLADPIAAQSLGETAKTDALQKFHPRHIALRHLEIYREVLSKS